jgi:hypothetical protein
MKIIPCVLAIAWGSVAFGDVVLTGAVTDKLGGAIPDATIIVRWDHAGSDVGLDSNVGIRKDLILTTDHSGTFAVDLPPGFYDLFVSAASFTPACRKIRLNKAARASLRFRLGVDPLVTEELGDRFPTKR